MRLYERLKTTTAATGGAISAICKWFTDKQ